MGRGWWGVGGRGWGVGISGWGWARGWDLGCEWEWGDILIRANVV